MSNPADVSQSKPGNTTTNGKQSDKPIDYNAEAWTLYNNFFELMPGYDPFELPEADKKSNEFSKPTDGYEVANAATPEGNKARYEKLHYFFEPGPQLFMMWYVLNIKIAVEKLFSYDALQCSVFATAADTCSLTTISSDAECLTRRNICKRSMLDPSFSNIDRKKFIAYWNRKYGTVKNSIGEALAIMQEVERIKGPGYVSQYGILSTDLLESFYQAADLQDNAADYDSLLSQVIRSSMDTGAEFGAFQTAQKVETEIDANIKARTTAGQQTQKERAQSAAAKNISKAWGIRIGVALAIVGIICFVIPACAQFMATLAVSSIEYLRGTGLIGIIGLIERLYGNQRVQLLRSKAFEIANSFASKDGWLSTIASLVGTAASSTGSFLFGHAKTFIATSILGSIAGAGYRYVFGGTDDDKQKFNSPDLQYATDRDDYYNGEPIDKVNQIVNGTGEYFPNESELDDPFYQQGMFPQSGSYPQQGMFSQTGMYQSGTIPQGFKDRKIKNMQTSGATEQEKLAVSEILRLGI